MWGGDGTVRRAADTLLGKGYDHVAIGILPAGTGNLLANNLDIPIDLRGAVDVALHGEVERIDEWVREAVAAGARVLTGGTRVGDASYAPTVLTNVPRDARVCSQEVFAPIVVLERFTSIDEAVAGADVVMMLRVQREQLERELGDRDLTGVPGPALQAASLQLHPH